MNWTVEKQKNGTIVVQNKEIGGCVLEKDHDDATVSVLFEYFDSQLKDEGIKD